MGAGCQARARFGAVARQAQGFCPAKTFHFAPNPTQKSPRFSPLKQRKKIKRLSKPFTLKILCVIFIIVKKYLGAGFWKISITK